MGTQAAEDALEGAVKRAKQFLTERENERGGIAWLAWLVQYGSHQMCELNETEICIRKEITELHQNQLEFAQFLLEIGAAWDAEHRIPKQRKGEENPHPHVY